MKTHAVKTSDYSVSRRLAKSDYDAAYREALGVKVTQIIDPTEKLNPERIKQESLKQESAKEPLKAEEPVKEELAEEPVKDMKNAYVRQNQESSIAHVEWEKYQERINKPLSHAVDRIITNLGVGGRDGMKQITDYMIQRHGLERNRVMYVRDTIRSIADSKPKKAEKMQ